MKSIKPGRGPSGMSFIGSIIAIIFGLFWTIMAARITSQAGMMGSIFPLFGILFIIVGIIQAVYHYKNATGKDRYSLFDITEAGEEGDPAEQWIKKETGCADERKQQRFGRTEASFCPYCGTKLKTDYVYCPKCGKEI